MFVVRLVGRRISLKFSLYVEKLADKPKRHTKLFVVRLVGRRISLKGPFIDAISNPYIGAHEKGFRFSNRETESFPFI